MKHIVYYNVGGQGNKLGGGGGILNIFHAFILDLLRLKSCFPSFPQDCKPDTTHVWGPSADRTWCHMHTYPGRVCKWQVGEARGHSNTAGDNLIQSIKW